MLKRTGVAYERKNEANPSIASCNKATQGSGEAASSTTSAQPTLFSQDANFLYICDV